MAAGFIRYLPRRPASPDEKLAPGACGYRDAVIGCDDRVQGRVEQNLERAVGIACCAGLTGCSPISWLSSPTMPRRGYRCRTRCRPGRLDTAPDLVCSGAWRRTPHYAHLPVATNPAGEKWSKQTLAPAISPAEGVACWRAPCAFLGQPVPEEAAA